MRTLIITENFNLLPMEVMIRKDNFRFVENIPINSMSSEINDKQKFKNFGLTEIQFATMIEELIQGHETLFEKAFLNHFDRSMKYLINKNGANKEVAYDITMNTLLEFRKRLLQGKVKYGNLNFLFTQMCSQRYKREMSKKIDNETYQQVNADDPTFDEEMYELLDKTIQKLGADCQSLIKDVYYNKISYKDLESKYSKAITALRKQKERCITKLKMLIRQNLNTI